MEGIDPVPKDGALVILCFRFAKILRWHDLMLACALWTFEGVGAGVVIERDKEPLSPKTHERDLGLNLSSSP
jgi:hypothetical protein